MTKAETSASSVSSPSRRETGVSADFPLGWRQEAQLAGFSWVIPGSGDIHRHGRSLMFWIAFLLRDGDWVSFPDRPHGSFT